ncbi:hypothetical protein BDW71DRAFT_213493 [Aspergillus fruticulosus]
MKVAKSCKECRRAKRRCSPGASPRSSCSLCAQKGLYCSLAASSLSHLKSIAPAVTALAYSVEVGVEVRDQLIDFYLKFIHDKPHTLFHPTTLKSRVQAGSLPEATLFSILALAARFADEQTIRERAKAFFQTAKESFKRTLDDVTLDNVHAAALIGNLCGVEGDSKRESLFFGISFRMAQILRLPETSPEDDRIMRETKIRTYWSLYMIDQWSSAGLDMPRQISDTDQNPLPVLELEFWKLRPGEQHNGTAEQKHSPGLWGYMVILARIFGKIHELHRQLVNSRITDTETEERTRALALEIETFAHNLPANVKHSQENLEHHARLGLGATFVALHLGYHHYSTLLYFHYLDSTLTQVPNQSLFAARCKYHAAAFSDLLSLSSRVPGCEAFSELPDARTRLYSNFQVLLKLKQYWPDVDTMIARLFAFQGACMRSTDQVYVVDKWIVKFLLQHALPIEQNRRPPPTEYLAERDKFAEDALSILRPME